jgi:PAS domain S-box-containing protein
MEDLGKPAFDLLQFFELTPDLVCISGKDGFFKHVNFAVMAKLGYTKAELFAVPISTFIHPSDKEITAGRRAELLTGKALTNFQNRYVAKDGSVVWLHWTSIFIPDKELVFAIAKDVTERKLSEQQIEDNFRKFKSLASHFKSSLEKDRKLMAVELHEQLAQLAATVKMDLQWVVNNTPDIREASRLRIVNAIEVSQLLIGSIRRISYTFSPDMIENIGLKETLKWLADEFSILHDILCGFECSTDVEHLPHEIKLDIFRICQEALANVTYHAQATEVKISIGMKEDQVCLMVTDNGKIDESKYRERLTEVRERVASINAQLSIISDPGKGTTISVIINQDHF